MRKIAKAVLPLVMAPFFLVSAGSAAHASTTSACYSGVDCEVKETMNSGFCFGDVQDTTGSKVTLYYLDAAGTGYDCRFWMERNVNNTGWYNESGYVTLAPDTSYTPQNYWDGPGYQARVCFQFLWSGTSNPGAVHCSPGLTN
ncbi:hypothetical protein EDD99_3933 [Streptomyces sp. 846.5]|nr:hypothetical protein [Streptomyces sp. 846.5]TDU05421.1 hypothetical protein EDD99_3933 [Streptomyces sp. 846.5]